MPDSLQIFGKTYTGVTGIVTKNTSDNDVIFTTGGEAAPSDAVRFIDYDGSIVHAYSATDFLALSSMPANPSHAGLVAQGWNWDFNTAQTYVQKWGYLDVGQQYITESGDTEIDIEFPTGFKRLNPYLSLAVNGTVQINWGDGSSVDTVTGTNISAQIRTPHIYSNTGKYTISIHLVSGSFCFYNTSVYFLLNADKTSANYNRVYANCITAIRLGSNSINNTISNYGLAYCGSLKYITIPKKLTDTSSYIFGSSCFYHCYSLKCITFPKGMTGSQGFSSCCSLKYALLSDTITDLASSMFNGSILDSFIVPENCSTNNTIFGTSSSYTPPRRRIIIPYQNYKFIAKEFNGEEQLIEKTQVKTHEFDSINNIYNITIPNTVTTINTYAFYYCRYLNTVTLPSSITTINESAFFYCHSLESIDLSHIGSFNNRNVCSYCYALQDVAMPSSATNGTMGNSYFSNSFALREVLIPNNITSLNNQTFGNCYSLASIKLPNSLTSLTTQVFYNCYCLSEITIPATVTSIGSGAFYGCYGIKEYHFLPTTPPTLDTNVFFGIASDCIIYVPYSEDHSILNTYKTATNWSTWASYIQEEPQ